MRITFLSIAIIGTAITSALFIRGSQTASAPDLTTSAEKFVKTLGKPQMDVAVLPYDGEQRTNWNFVPMVTRKGLPLGDMTQSQRTAAMQVLRSAVSQLGYEKATAIMSLEGLLRELEGTKGVNRRDPERYYFTMYGKPSPSGTWGLSVEGHHLSLNFVVENGKIVDSTPQFFATNPAELKESYSEKFPAGFRVLDVEETIAFQLINGLPAEQKEKAIFAPTALKEIVSANAVQPPAQEKLGIAVSQMAPGDQHLLMTLISAYTSKMADEVATERWAAIEKNGWDEVYFGWAGATEPGIGHYYRIHGPSFLVEFVNTQPDAAGNPANHIHCVWRDVTGDFNLPAN